MSKKEEVSVKQGRVRVGDVVWVWAPPLLKPLLSKKPLNSDEMYIQGSLDSVAGGKANVSVKRPDGMLKVALELDQILPCNTETGREDICTLTQMNEATVLDNLAARFAKDEVYTWISTILIALNPFAARPENYTLQVQQHYRSTKPENVAPHIYAVAEKAFRRVARTRPVSQSIVVSGESGAGKTFTNKLLLSYLSFRSGAETAGGEVAKVMSETGTILEAFGNAKTTRNNNSSRFGKFNRCAARSRAPLALPLDHDPLTTTASPALPTTLRPPHSQGPLHNDRADCNRPDFNVPSRVVACHRHRLARA